MDHTVRRIAARLACALAVLATGTSLAAPGDPLGPPQVVNVSQAGSAVGQAVLADSTGFRAYWAGPHAAGASYSQAYETRFDHNGARLSGDLSLYSGAALGGSDPLVAAAAADGRRVLVRLLWNGSRYLLLAQRLGTTGLPIGPEVEVTDPASPLSDAAMLPVHAVAMNDAGEFVVVWYEPILKDYGNPCIGVLVIPGNCLDNRQSRLLARRYSAAGVAEAPMVVASGDHLTIRTLRSPQEGGGYATNSIEAGNEVSGPVVAMDMNGGFAVAWINELWATYSVTGRQLKLRHFPRAGNAPLARVVENTTARMPEVAFDPAGDIIVAYCRHPFLMGYRSEFWLRRYSGVTHKPLADAQRIDSGSETQVCRGLALATDAAGFSVAWAVLDEGVRLTRFDPHGVVQRGPVLVSAAGGRNYTTPRLAARGNRLMVLWTQNPSRNEWVSDVMARTFEGP